MEIAKAELLDKLRRAYEMEEVMAAALIELVQNEILTDEIPTGVRSRVVEAIASIKEDTLRHRETVGDLIKKAAEGTYEA